MGVVVVGGRGEYPDNDFEAGRGVDGAGIGEIVRRVGVVGARSALVFESKSKTPQRQGLPKALPY